MTPKKKKSTDRLQINQELKFCKIINVQVTEKTQQYIYITFNNFLSCFLVLYIYIYIFGYLIACPSVSFVIDLARVATLRSRIIIANLTNSHFNKIKRNLFNFYN